MVSIVTRKIVTIGCHGESERVDDHDVKLTFTRKIESGRQHAQDGSANDTPPSLRSSSVFFTVENQKIIGAFFMLEFIEPMLVI